MKRTIRIFSLAAALVLPLASCMDEPEMTNGATQEQVSSSSVALEASLYAIPVAQKQCFVVAGDNHYDWGYGSIMHIRDIMTEECAINYSTYDHYSAYEENSYLGKNYQIANFAWTFFYKYVQTANNVLASVDTTTATDEMLGYAGAALAFRAHAYLDLAQMYGFQPSDVIPDAVSPDGKDITDLTVPITTENTTPELSKNNPRAKKADMVKFIEGDLNNAERYIVNYKRASKVMPDLSVVYGLKARLYMYAKDYANAALYARKAIDLGQNTPMTREECLDPTTGFNTAVSSWMWDEEFNKEDDCVTTGIINWISWVTPEYTGGYASYDPYMMAGKQFYDKIENADFRKLWFKAPDGSPLASKVQYVNAETAANFEPYTSVKFRPGQGNTDDYQVACCVAMPLMRIEEMYLIEAEAVAHSDAARGKALLESFMQTYRYKNYTCRASDEEGVVDEIFLQKRIELWGEGLSFFDYKRLDKPVTRAYDGSNFEQNARFNTTTAPAWMTFCWVAYENDVNQAIREYNNPDPSDRYTAQ